MPDKKQCSKCGKITDRIKITKKGTVLCGHCIQDLVQPPCQYPGCKNKCDHPDHLLCEFHFKAFTNGFLKPEMQEAFEIKFQENNIPYTITKPN